MRAFRRFTDRELASELAACAATERTATAEFIACIEEFDARRLYLPAGYPSMYQYCLYELHLSEDAACRRIRAARAVRSFPMLLDALEDGRLHLSGLSLLAPHLKPLNFEVLFGDSVGKTKKQIEELIASHFPQSESLPLITAVPSSWKSIDPTMAEQAAVEEPVVLSVPGRINAGDTEQSGAHIEHGAPQVVGNTEPQSPLVPPALIRPIATERFTVQITVPRSARDKLEYAQALLSHAIPSGDLAQVFERALDALIARLEKRRFAALDRPRVGPGKTA